MRKTKNTQNISQEELLKTQVLNLNDLEKVAKFEKKTSKKPAVLLAIIGAFSIMTGLTYPYITTTLRADKVESNVSKNIDNNEDINSIASKVQEETLNCTYTQMGNPDGTDTAIALNFIFNEHKLQGYTKIINITPTLGNATGPVTIQNFLSAYQAIELTPLTGYTIKTIQTETGGMQTTVNIDLTTLNKETLTPAHIANPYINAEYELNTEKTAITTSLTASGYTCQ